MTPRRPGDKIYDREALLRTFGRPRSDRVVFTNGCFDLLHPGHVAYLHEARELGDRLVVGVNTDDSVRRLGKGTDRPVLDEEARAAVVAGLESVDAVCLFDEDTPRQLIAALLPDVVVKGADYSLDQVVGREEVEAAGGRVQLIPLLPGHSTTTIVNRIKGDTT